MDRQTILDQLASLTTLDQIHKFHASYLGKKGQISSLFKTLKDLPPEQKKQKGKEIKALFDEISIAFEAKQREIKQTTRDAKLASEIVDYSLPGRPPQLGHYTLLTQMRRQVEEIFQGMGFTIDYGHDLVTQYENFSSVNIPPTHPATEMHDTLYLQQTDEQDQQLLMRTHTSAHQNELIQRLGTPCKFVVPGKVYRNENMDASHDCVFRQIEGVVIDKGISIAHLKGMMKQILSALLQKDVQLRMRPGYFPFVEPGIEIDARHQVGTHHKWLELLGAGMIHPEVLSQAGVDSTERSGFAFGVGMTRLVAIKHDIHDIRLLTNSDVRFVRSF